MAAMLASPLAAAYASRDLVVPIAGRSVGADGRVYLTALWITNTSDRPADAAITFHPAALNTSPISSSLQLAAGETRLLDPYDPGGDAATGWIRIQSARDLLVSTRLYSRMPSETTAQSIGASIAAIPTRFAIANGESTTLHGLTPADARFKLTFDEVSGKPLEVWVALLDAHGVQLARTHLYVDAWRQQTKDAAELFPAFTSGAAIVRVEGMHGKGRVIVAGTSIAKASQDATGFEMSFTPASRDRISWAEAVAYGAVAIGILAAIATRRR